MKVAIRPDEAVTVLGRKGSGKTTVLLELLKQVRPKGRHRYIVLDTKQVGDFKGYPTTDQLRNVPKLVEKNPIVVYAPNKYEAKDPDYHEGFFNWAYERWDTTVLIDELTSIVWGNDVPDSYKDITDRGRARRVTFWQGNQKPVFVPHAALSEADHFFVFDLQLKAAREKMAGILGDEVMARPKDRHGFWYSHFSLQNPIYVPKLEIRSGKPAASQ